MATVSKMEWLVVKLKVYVVTISILAISIITYLATVSNENTYIKALNIIALGMIPACLIGVFWEAFIKHEFIEYIQREIHLGNKLHKYGISGIFSNRSEINLREHFQMANRRVWILVTSLNFLTETPGLLDALTFTAKAGVDLRILALDPKSQSTKLRAAYNPIYKSLKDEIAFSVEKLMSEFNKTETSLSNVQLRFYDKIPTCACFIIDNKLFICPLLCHKRGRNSTHLLISTPPEGNPTQIFEEYESHFIELFNNSKSSVRGTSARPSSEAQS
jgi:hypothetical protein